MTNLLPPALTPEEWSKGWARYSGGDPAYDGQEVHYSCHNPACVCVSGSGVDEPRMKHALAALCLYNQSYGMTHKDVALLRWVTTSRECNIPEQARTDAADLASRIAALLPPSEYV